MMSALCCHDSAATALYMPKIIHHKPSPLLLKRKNHSWRPAGKKQVLEKFGYVFGQTIGEGAHSKIKLAYIPKEEEYAAVKIIEKNRIQKDIYEKFVKREIYIMQLFQHPHILAVNEVVESKNHLYIVMEYAPNGDLLEYVNEAGALPETEARRLFRQMVAAVKVLHDCGVVHRDLKLENVLLDEDFNVKLADFGFSRLQYKNELCHTFCGSYAYAAPEILDGDVYDGMLADVWSLGVCLYGMLHGRLPFHEEDVDILRQSIDEDIRITPSVSQECSQLLQSMLTVDLKKRATFAGVTQSPWMTIPIVTLTQSVDDDLDSTWSIISREREAKDESSVCTESTYCGYDFRETEDPHQPVEHGYNNDQHHTSDDPASLHVVTDVLTAVVLTKREEATSPPLGSGTNIGIEEAVGRKISCELQSTLASKELGKGSTPNLIRRRSSTLGSYRRRSLTAKTTGRTSLQSVDGCNQKPPNVNEKSKRQNDINDLKYSNSGKVAKYLSEERQNNTDIERKVSLQRMTNVEDDVEVDRGILNQSSSWENFVSKCYVALPH